MKISPCASETSEGGRGKSSTVMIRFHFFRLHYLIISSFKTWAAVPQDGMKGSERQILTGRSRRRERQRILSYEFKRSYGHEDIIEILMIKRLQSFSIPSGSELSAR